MPSTPVVTGLLSRGTRCYGLYENPASGSQGSVTIDGREAASGRGPSLPPAADEPADAVLLSFLHRFESVAYACAFAGLDPADSAALTWRAGRWVRLPARDYWAI
jgi:hypothetical protein